MEVKKFYETIGGSYDEAIGRLMRDKLVEKYVRKFSSDQSFATLKAAMDEERVDDAFAAAHTLKGVSMNLAFAKLSASAVTLTDYLRPANRANMQFSAAKEMFVEVEKDYNALMDQIAIFTAE